MTRIILILLSVVAIDAIAQVKYTKPGEKMTLGALSYSRPRGDGLWSLQASFTPDSRGALGLNASINPATTAKTLGIFAEGAIVKPDSSLRVGFDLVLAGSKIWARRQYSYQQPILAGQSALLGIELYFGYPGSRFMPFLQLSRTFTSLYVDNGTARSEVTGIAVGLDIVVFHDKRPMAILTPGVVFAEDQFALVISISLVLSYTGTR